MSLEWTELDRLARRADPAAVTGLLLRVSERQRLAFATELESRIRALSPDDWWSDGDPAAGYALAAIGCLPSAARAAALLCRRDLRSEWSHLPVDRFLEIARARELPWLGDLAVRLAERLPTRDPSPGEWRFVAALLHEAGVAPPVTEAVVRGWLVDMHRGEWGARAVPLIVRLRESPHLDLLLPAVFEIDGVGGALNANSWNEHTEQRAPAPRFPDAVARLVAEGRLDRAQVLDATVDRLVRGDRPAWLRPFALLHDALAPTVDECADRVLDYARLLPDAPSTVAGLAQRALRAVDDAGRLELDTLLDASQPTLLRTEKALVKSQLSWLERVAARERDRSGAVLETVSAAFAHPALDIQERALTLIGRRGARLDPAVAARIADAATALAGDLPGRAAALLGVAAPRTEPAIPALPPLPAPAAMPPPIADPIEFAAEVVTLIHGGSAVRWERVLAGIVSLRAAGETGALAAALKPVVDRHVDSFVEHSGDPRSNIVLLGEALRSLLDPADTGRGSGGWQRMASAALAVAREGRRRRDRWPPATPEDVLALRLAEIAAQLAHAPVPLLVCTPTLTNGSLDAETLLRRLLRAEAEGWQPWPIDFEQALLRVPRRVDDAVRARAAALTSPMGRRFAGWLAAGGLPDPVSTRFEQRARPGEQTRYGPPGTARRVVVNLRPARADGLRLESPLTTLRRRQTPICYFADLIGAADILAMVLPQHREVVAAWALPELAGLADQDEGGGGTLLAPLVACSGPIGPATSLALAYGLAARQPSDRVAAVDAFLALAAGDQPFAATVGIELGDLCGDGTVKLTRVVPALDDAHRAGASAAVWELLTAALPLLLPAAPRGLPDALELATRVAAATGARDEIAHLSATAARRGSSRLVKEARRLHAVLGS